MNKTIDSLKILFLYLLKYTGLFYLSRSMTRKNLRILCYHGFTLRDEDKWMPGLFIRKDTFYKRLNYLKKANYAVLDLGKAVEGLKKEDLPLCPTVITIDDGWYDIIEIAHPLLKTFDFPYTIYVSSYYSIKQTPIFNIVIPYLIWKSKNASVVIDHDLFPKKAVFNLETEEEKKKFSDTIIEYGHNRLNHEQRQELLVYMAGALHVDLGPVVRDKLFHLITRDDIRKMVLDKVDFQLHTHRHRWPKLKKDADREIEDNRKFLNGLTGYVSNHFCYPSGVWTKEQIPFLESAGIKSSTTCDHGLNMFGDHVHYLKRILDGENKRQIEIEAELSGLKDVFIKPVLSWLRDKKGKH